MNVTVLGCGTSHGVPMIGCECAVCSSTDPHNKRLRPSILVTTDIGENIIVDTPPEMRLALIANNVRSLSSILMTHSHADHIFGMDDVRPFNYRQGAAVPIFAEATVREDIRRIFEYAFKSGPIGGGRPQIELRDAVPLVPIVLAGITVFPLRVFHGNLPVLAFKFGAHFAYVTDVSSIPPETVPHLMNLDLLLLDAVRREKHETHFNLEEALAAIRMLKPKRAFLTHLSHDFDFNATNRELPDGVQLTYDGAVYEVQSS